MRNIQTKLATITPVALLALLIGVLAPWRAAAVGSWATVVKHAPNAVELILLLSDGSVMAQQQGISANWYRLTPDIHGSYVNGTWTTLKSMHDPRLYYSSAVLRDGRVFVA